VIGILIAIQLNEWRQNISNKQQKQNILTALQLEFTANLSQLDTVLFYNEKILNTYPKVMRLIESKDSLISEKVRFDFVLDLGWTWSFNPSNGALRSGISSGEIHLINDDRLIELLFSWEDVVKDSEEEGIQLFNYQYESKLFLQKHIRFADVLGSYYLGTKSNYPSDYSALFNDVAFEDYASFCAYYALAYVEELNIIKTNNLEILELINEELDKL
jgi:hypothetical protein